MLDQLPKLLRRALLALLAGIVLLMISLIVSKPLSYIFTIGAGSCLVLLGVLAYAIFYWRELRGADENSG
jgi:hypothetical protein